MGAEIAALIVALGGLISAVGVSAKNLAEVRAMRIDQEQIREQVPEGIQLTQSALQGQVGDWAGPFLSVVIFFLAWSSVLGNTYYGEANIRYLAGRHAGPAITVFRVLVLVCVVGGALGSVALVWNLADTFAALMATINLVAIIPLGGLAVKLLRDYERKLKAGMNPGFHISDLPEARNVALWRDEPKTSPLQD